MTNPAARLASFSFADALVVLRPILPEVLISPEAFGAAATFVEDMPPIFHWGVLETRLIGDRRRVDVLAAVVATGREEQEVGVHVRGERVHPSLAGASRFLSTWARGDADLSDVKVIWLEWDAPFQRDAAPLQLPSIDPRFWGPPGTAAPTGEQQVASASASYAAIFGGPPPAAQMAGMRQMIAALPPSAEALAVASLRPRGLEVHRLFAGVPRGRVMGWLDAIGWPGDRTVLIPWLRAIVQSWEPAYLQVEVGDDGVTPYLGIEPQQSSSDPAALTHRWRFLDDLADRGDVDLAAVEAVKAWPGTRVVDLGGAARVEHRSIHLKLVLQRDRPVDLKAYFGFHYERP